MSDWITTEAAADLLACSENWLCQPRRNLVRKVIRHRRDGRRWLWRRADCEYLLELRRSCGGRLPDAARVMMHLQNARPT